MVWKYTTLNCVVLIWNDTLHSVTQSKFWELQCTQTYNADFEEYTIFGYTI